jgi:hypothetical protein
VLWGLDKISGSALGAVQKWRVEEEAVFTRRLAQAPSISDVKSLLRPVNPSEETLSQTFRRTCGQRRPTV